MIGRTRALLREPAVPLRWKVAAVGAIVVFLLPIPGPFEEIVGVWLLSRVLRRSLAYTGGRPESRGVAMVYVLRRVGVLCVLAAVVCVVVLPGVAGLWTIVPTWLLLSFGVGAALAREPAGELSEPVESFDQIEFDWGRGS